ncbi:hypothetical protein DBR46_01940 [Pseudomonas sp. KBW05]|nr:hypothetical protein DBR46_01940 [Pseudomonas sp. KBW05]
MASLQLGKGLYVARELAPARHRSWSRLFGSVAHSSGSKLPRHNKLPRHRALNGETYVLTQTNPAGRRWPGCRSPRRWLAEAAQPGQRSRGG